MRAALRLSTLALALLGWAHAASAQTADDVIQKSIAALGGRPALIKITSRTLTGTITLTTPAGDISGPIEIVNAVPNKSRSLLKADLTALGAGEFVLDQRFDGTAGYALDSLQGNRDITGNQLDNLRNGSFPHPFLTYKEMGIAVKLVGTEKIGGRDAHVLLFEPPSGSAVRQFIDAQTFLPIRTVLTVNVPQIGQDVEQATDYSDYRDVDGVKIAFHLEASSPVQTYTIVVAAVVHNAPIDETLFSKPRE